MNEPDKKIEASAEKLQSDLEKLQKLNQEYLDGWKRAKADYINFKKEAEKEKMQIVQFANAALLLELMPIVDDLKTALKHMPAEQKGAEWAKGFEHILKKFLNVMKELGVEQIPAIGEKFDPGMHEAVSKEKKADTEPGIILEEIATGYTLQGKVIKHSKVKVSE